MKIQKIKLMNAMNLNYKSKMVKKIIEKQMKSF